MEPCGDGRSMRFKQRAVIEFLTAEGVTPKEIHQRMQAVYGDCVDEKMPTTAVAVSDAGLPPLEPGASPTRIRGKAQEEELQPPVLETPPRPSLSGSHSVGLWGVQNPPSSGIRNQDLRHPKHRPAPGKRYQCTGDGCRLACRSMQELLDHMRAHFRPTQSLEGKTFSCSTLGCLESFPDMQSLMEHMKAHYKPNRYFKCENCMSRFRTHRSLFKHLHSCLDAAVGRHPLPTEKPPSVVGKVLEELPKLQSVLQSIRKDAVLPTKEAVEDAPDDPLSIELHGGSSTDPEPLSPPDAHPFPLLEQSLFGPPTLARFSGSVPGPFLPYMNPPGLGLPPTAVQNRLRPFLPGQGLPVSNAVWKKSQGHSSNSRIVWEHTRGRYNCLQCPYSTASREEMTQHTEEHRKNPSPPGRLDGEMDFGVAIPSFHPKLTPPDVENPLFSPL
ncbi:zinc finger protein 414 [Anolis carolinensis]|uniref:zinc finger protein 414 n=1 Tax=Anolis carolinensis TaxID=28377 RepID=UPI002F2B6ECD